MDKTKLDSLLYSSQKYKHNDDENVSYKDHYLEQYRMYLHIFNSTTERRNKSNEFFLGLNTAIIGILGYLEAKNLNENNTLIFLFIPLIGIAISFFWYQIIMSYKQLSRAKFNVIHNIEENLPISLFRTEWELLGRGLDYTKYRKISSIEKNIPIVFIILYSVILGISLPIDIISILIR